MLSFSSIGLSNDTITVLTNQAEKYFLKGNIIQAATNYSAALDWIKNIKEQKKTPSKISPVKLIELLAIAEQSIGECDIAIGYLRVFINENSDKRLMANALKEVIKCNHKWPHSIDEALQNRLLAFFNLQRIDESFNLQLTTYMNDPNFDSNELDEYFYLVENGLVPALNSLEREAVSARKVSERGWVIISALFTIIALGFFLYTINKKKEHLSKEKLALLTGKQGETHRLSIDLHDILGYKIVELKDRIDRLTIKPHTDLKSISDGLDELHHSMRYIVQANLTPQSLKLGLSPALDTLLNRVNELGIIKFQLYKHGLEERLYPEVEKQVFFLIQELVNNIIKHSKGSKATFEISKNKNELTIIAEDNGIGYTPSIDTLKSVKARVSFLGGKVIEDVEMDRGAVIVVNINV